MTFYKPKATSLPTKDLIKYASIIGDNFTYTCKCGHRVVMNNQQKRILCTWCNHYVYRDKKDEFMERVSNLCKKKQS